MRLREYAVLFTLALIWGASFFFIKVAVLGVSPATLVFGRLASSVLVLSVVALAQPRLIAGWRSYAGLAALVGVVNLALPFLLIAWGETRIASGTASILDATTPLFTVVLAHWWSGPGRERLTARRLGGVALGFAGVALLVGPAALAGGGSGLASVAGEGAVLLAALAYGIGTLLSQRFNGTSVLIGPLGEQAGALLLVLPVAALWSPPRQLPALPVFGAILMLGVPGLAVAYLLYFWLIRHVGASRTSLVTYLLPCTALLWGALLLHERITGYAVAGLALVLLGTMVTNGTLAGLRRRTGWHMRAEITGGAVATERET